MPIFNTQRGGLEERASSGGRGAQRAHEKGYGTAPRVRVARQVMRDAGVRTSEQYLDKLRKGEIWGGVCEVGRWAQRRGCKIALYTEWGPRGMYRKMADVGEGRQTAAALLWSRRGGGHYELRWPPEEEEVAEAGEGDRSETAEVEEVALEVKFEAEGQGLEGRQGGQAEERVWQDVHQIQIQEGGAGWRYEGQEGPMRERREVVEGTARDRKLRARWEEVLGVQVQAMEYEEVPEGTGNGEWKRRQVGGVDVRVSRGGEGVLQLQHRYDLGAGWGAEGAVRVRTDRAVWLEPGWRGRYRMAAGEQRW